MAESYIFMRNKLILGALSPLISSEVLKGQEARACLVWGGSGNGKTFETRKLLADCGVAVFELNCSRLDPEDGTDSHILQIQLLFRAAKEVQPSVVFLDDVHVLTPQKATKKKGKGVKPEKEKENQATQGQPEPKLDSTRVSNAIAQCAQSLSDEDYIGLVMVSGAKGCALPKMLEPLVASRVFVTFPDAAARRDILRHSLAERAIVLGAPAVTHLERITEGLSISQLLKLGQELNSSLSLESMMNLAGKYQPNASTRVASSGEQISLLRKT